MSRPAFFDMPTPMSLAALASECRADIPADVDPSRLFRPAWPLDRAGRDDVGFFFDLGEVDDLIATRAGACFVSHEDQPKVPLTTIALVTEDPLDAFRRLIVGRQTDATLSAVISTKAAVHREAMLEQGVTIDPGVIIGPQAEIGSATVIGANSVIGGGVRIGRGCRIGSHVSIRNALIGDRVHIQAGARIGTRSLQAPNLRSTPWVGRVIVQDDVEIGPNAVVDRGQVRDTMIGERARIGALASVKGGSSIDRCRWVRVDTFCPEPDIG